MQDGKRSNSDRKNHKRSMNDMDGMSDEKKLVDCMKQKAGDMNSDRAEKNDFDNIIDEEVNMNGVGDERSEIDDKSGLDELVNEDDRPLDETVLSPEHRLFLAHLRRWCKENEMVSHEGEHFRQ